MKPVRLLQAALAAAVVSRVSKGAQEALQGQKQYWSEKLRESRRAS